MKAKKATHKARIIRGTSAKPIIECGQNGYFAYHYANGGHTIGFFYTLAAANGYIN